MGKFRDFFFGAPRLERRDMSWWTQDWESPFGPVAGQPVTSKTMLGLSAAWDAVGLLSDSIATLPVDAFIEDGEERIPVPAVARPRWIDNPGNGLTRIDLLNQTMVSLLIQGEAFLVVSRSSPIGPIEQLRVFDPTAINVDAEGQWRFAGEPIADHEFVHIKGMMMPGDNRGMGVITYAREGISASLATQKFGEAFFGNGAWTGTVVEVPGTLSEDGQAALKAYVNERHRGAGRAHKVGILTEGATLSRPITFSPEDSQFLDTREFQVADIARFFRVPPEMIGGKSTDALTYSTLEGRSTHFVKFSCLPWIVRIENAFTQLWRSEDGPENGVIKLNVNGLLRGSTKERYDAYKIGIEAGFLTVNDVRALEDMPPLAEPPKPPTPEPPQEGEQ
jgi:HK97 family phage portal protein